MRRPEPEYKLTPSIQEALGDACWLFLLSFYPPFQGDFSFISERNGSMHTDAFSKRHPIVNFIFFLGAIGFGVVIQHPVYLAAGFVFAAAYYLLLKGRAGFRLLFALVPLFLIMMAVNPLFNTYGATTLFRIFGRPYTLEALLYGAAVAAVLVVMLIWFGCYNAVLTSDKFTSLFGNVIPALSLLLVMVLRMIPNLMRKTAQFAGARKSIGKGSGENATNKEKLTDGMTILSALTDWALEGGVITGDSMRSRGYGCAKRTSFVIYRITGIDAFLLVVQILLAAAVLATAICGGTTATYTPDYYIAPVSGLYLLGFAAYCMFLSIPTVLHIKEAIQWHISRSRI